MYRCKFYDLRSARACTVSSMVMASAGSGFSDSWVFSKPVVVCGSMTPPPSVSLPGARCYLVRCWARGAPGLVYYGLGPSSRIAKKAAQINAEVRRVMNLFSTPANTVVL